MAVLNTEVLATVFPDDSSPSIMKNILLVCNDTIGQRMAGPAIRCIELAKVLSREFSVTVAARNLDTSYIPPVPVVPATADAISEVAQNADVVIVQGDALQRFPALLEGRAMLVADMYCPVPLEYHMSAHSEEPGVRLRTGWHLAQTMQQQLYYADHFICASERQRDFWFGGLTIAGRVNALSMPDGLRSPVSSLISCVPFGLSDGVPTATAHPLREKFGIPQDAFLMVWGGGIYEWFDPLTIIRAVAELDRQGEQAHLVFMGVKHPNPNINEHDRVSEAVDLARELGVLDRLVHFNFGWVDYHERHEYLLDADVGVSAHLDNAETRFSFRTRMLDYLWCGLPILATKGDEFGEIVGREELGIAIDYEDSGAWCEAILRLKTDDQYRAQCEGNVTIVRERYTWARAAEPLVEVCRRALQLADREYSRSHAVDLKFGPNLARPSLLQRVMGAYGRYGLVGTVRAVCRRAGLLRD